MSHSPQQQMTELAKLAFQVWATKWCSVQKIIDNINTCKNHGDITAQLKCRSCNNLLCEACVKTHACPFEGIDIEEFSATLMMQCPLAPDHTLESVQSWLSNAIIIAEKRLKSP